MSDQTFFVKIRGRVLGPFAPDRLSEMAQRGQLSRVHMLSTDGNHWQKASEFPELFQAGVTERGKKEPRTSDSQSDSQSDGQKGQAPEQEQWHYGIADQSYGPVSKSTIVNLISTGQMNETDMVWQTNMGDWTTVQSVPEFAMVIEQQRAAINASTVKTGVAATETADLVEATHVIRSQTPWVFFICIVMYLVSAALFFFFIFALVQGAQRQNAELIFSAVTALLQMAVIITAAIFLNRFGSSANRFVVTKDVSELNTALQWLGRFWLFLSIVLIIWLVFFVVIVIYVYTLNRALFP